MDSVSIAFELVRLELEAAVESLNSQGAKFFHDSRYDEARDLIEKGTGLRAFCTKVREIEREWREFHSKDYFEVEDKSQIEEKARKILSGAKSPRTGLLVKFPDGLAISEKTAADTLVEVIRRIGFEKVERLGIVVNGENIVSRIKSTKYHDIKSGGFFIKTHSSTDQKKRNIEAISEALNLSLDVRIIS